LGGEKKKKKKTRPKKEKGRIERYKVHTAKPARFNKRKIESDKKKSSLAAQSSGKGGKEGVLLPQKGGERPSPLRGPKSVGPQKKEKNMSCPMTRTPWKLIASLKQKKGKKEKGNPIIFKVWLRTDRSVDLRWGGSKMAAAKKGEAVNTPRRRNSFK